MSAQFLDAFFLTLAENKKLHSVVIAHPVTDGGVHPNWRGGISRGKFDRHQVARPQFGASKQCHSAFAQGNPARVKDLRFRHGTNNHTNGERRPRSATSDEHRHSQGRFRRTLLQTWLTSGRSARILPDFNRPQRRLCFSVVYIILIIGHCNWGLYALTLSLDQPQYLRP
jgi:hypothetical protein